MFIHQCHLEEEQLHIIAVTACSRIGLTRGGGVCVSLVVGQKGPVFNEQNGSMIGYTVRLTQSALGWTPN